jgi:hypothetical protein
MPLRAACDCHSPDTARDLDSASVAGTHDGGGNRATGNGNPLQCLNLACR